MLATAPMHEKKGKRPEPSPVEGSCACRGCKASAGVGTCAQSPVARNAITQSRPWNFADVPTTAPAPAVPSAVQHKAEVGAPNDPLEREADDVAERITSASAASDGIRGLAPGGAAPAAGISSGSAGRPLDRETRAFFEPRFGLDLGAVRLHDDAEAGRAARGIGARAYTAGNDIVLSRPLATDSDGGRRLLAHELAHTVQQSRGAAMGRPLPIQRQVLGSTELDAAKDPDCPPETPYRWGPKRGAGAADPAVVSPCMATPMPRPHGSSIGTLNVPDAPAANTQAPAAATPTPVVAPATAGPAPSTATTSSAPASKGDGLMKSDAALQMRPRPPAPVQLDGQAPNLACSYDERTIAQFSGVHPPHIGKLANDVRIAFTGCDIAYVSIIAATHETDDDSRETANARAESIRRSLIHALGYDFGEDRFSIGFSSGGPDQPDFEIRLGGRNKLGSFWTVPGDDQRDAAQTTDPGKRKPSRNETEQVSAQAGLGFVHHSYFTPPGSSAPLNEFLKQVTLAYTMQLHGNNESGEERQIFAQVQYSRTTRQFTLSFGGQESYVFALPAHLQLSFWAQLQFGENVSSGGSQNALSVGTQLVWQPKNWAAVGAQVGVGPTFPSDGPASIDTGGLIFFQIQK